MLRQWTGLCDLSPDYSPILGETEVEGFHVSAGWGTYGFKAAPIVGTTLAELVATRQDARADRAVRAGALLHRHARLRAGGRGRLPLMATQMPSVPRDRAGRARSARSPRSPTPPGSSRRGDRAVRPLQGEGRPRRCSTASPTGRTGSSIDVTAITPTKAGEGKTTTSVSLTQGLGHIGKKPGALPARGLARAGLRDQGRRGRRRLRAGRPDGGPEPPLHRRHPRDRRREQPARRAARGAPPARERARHRPALGQLAALRRHQRPRAARRSSSASAAARTATRARPASTSPPPPR